MDLETVAGLASPMREFAALVYEGDSEVGQLYWSASIRGPRVPPSEFFQALGNLWAEAGFVAAHNAGFDRERLMGLLQGVGQSLPELPFLCTLRLASRVFPGPRDRLGDVCERLGLPLVAPHSALADARAAAGIVVRAWQAQRAFWRADFLRPFRRRIPPQLLGRSQPTAGARA